MDIAFCKATYLFVAPQYVLHLVVCIVFHWLVVCRECLIFCTFPHIVFVVIYHLLSLFLSVNTYRPFRNFRNDYVMITCCHYGRICLLRERLAQAAVTSEPDRPTDLKEAKFTQFVSSSY